MNFIKAIQHATIGYGIRRRSWRQDAVLTVDNFGDLYWTSGVGTDTPVKLGVSGPGVDMTFDLNVEDIQARDWEVV